MKLDWKLYQVECHRSARISDRLNAFLDLKFPHFFSLVLFCFITFFFVCFMCYFRGHRLYWNAITQLF